jgi:hypothetical protein
MCSRQAQSRTWVGEFFNAELNRRQVADRQLIALETGRLAFGRVEPSDALLIESFVPVAGAPVPPPWLQRVEMMKEMIATVPETGTNTVLITHFPKIKAARAHCVGYKCASERTRCSSVAADYIRR